jgi:hypothetical protein
MTIIPAIAPNAPEKFENPRESFLRHLSQIVAEIYTTFSQMAENDRKHMLQLEMQFKKHSFDASDSMKSRGNLALASAVISLLVFAASFGLTNSNEQKFVQLASEKIPMITNIFDTRSEANIKTKDSVAQLEYSQLQEKHNKTQTDSNTKEQFASTLQAEIQRLRSAASSGN